MFRNNLFIQTVFIFHQVKEKHSLLRKNQWLSPAINKYPKGEKKPHTSILLLLLFLTSKKLYLVFGSQQPPGGSGTNGRHLEEELSSSPNANGVSAVIWGIKVNIPLQIALQTNSLLRTPSQPHTPYNLVTIFS